MPRRSVDTGSITNLRQSLSVRTEVEIRRAETAWFVHNSDSFETAMLKLVDTNDSRLVVRLFVTVPTFPKYSLNRPPQNAGDGHLPHMRHIRKERAGRDGGVVRGERL